MPQFPPPPPYSYRPSEADIQAEFYHQCRLGGLTCCLELSTPRGRLDIAITSEDRKFLLAIVECKRSVWRINYNSKQSTRYRSIGVDYFCIGSMADIPQTIFKLHLTMQRPPIPMEQVMSQDRHPLQRKLRRQHYRPSIEFDEDLNIKP